MDVDLKSWQITDTAHGMLLNPRLSDADKDLFRKVLKRDAYTCQYCGFQATEFQEINHKNHDHRDMRPENLETVCALCHRSFHLNMLHLHNAATLIWLPDIPQQTLNRLLRVIFVAKHFSKYPGCKDDPVAQNAYSYIYESLLRQQTQKIASIIDNKEMNDIATVAQILLDIKKEDPEKYKKRHDWLSHIKLLHHPESLEVQTEYWAENLYFKDGQPAFHQWAAWASNLSQNIIRN